MKKIPFLDVYKIIMASLVLALALPLIAADTGQINYQARLLDSYGRRVNAIVDLSFKIYDAAVDGNLLWSETQTDVVVQDGVYSVVLGSQTAIPASVFAQNTVYLELGIDGETMSPRQQITASAYSLVARTIMGSNVYENQTSGYVGIGTTNPAVKLDVSGAIQATGFKMPTGATANYVLASDADGVGTWQPYSVVVTEHDPIHTNWVRVVYTPATNNIWNAIGTEATTREDADTELQGNIDTEATTRQGNIDTASNALNTAVGLRMLRSGDVMTGPLTNNILFAGNGAGLTNVPASGLILTNYVQRSGDTMSGALVISNNLTVALTNTAGDFVATNSIRLGGMTISNWNQVTGGDLTNSIANLQGATGTLNTAVGNLTSTVNNVVTGVTALNTATNSINTAVTNNFYVQSLTNADFEPRIYASTTGKVDRAGDTMTGTLNLNTNLNVIGQIGTATNLNVGGNLVITNKVAIKQTIESDFSLGVKGNVVFQDASGDRDSLTFQFGSSVDIATYNYNSGAFPPLKIDGSNVFMVSSAKSGNISIGSVNNPSPTARLHVYGNAIIATNLTVNGTNIVQAIILQDAPAITNWLGLTNETAGLLGSIYARRDVGVTNIAAGVVTNTQITSSAVTEEKIADLAVTSGKIAQSAVTIGKIANNAVADSNIISASSWNNAVVMKYVPEGTSVTFSYSNLCYLAGNVWSNANANTNTTAKGLLGLALGSDSLTDGVLLNGSFANVWGFTPGDIIYMDTNNNNLTTSAPTGTNNVVRILGYCISTTNIYFNPDRTYIEITGQ